MNKLIITRINNRVLTALYAGSQPVQLDLEESGGSILGNIYVGKVQNVVKNINAAFVDIGNGLTGYYSLSENRNHFLTNVSARGEAPMSRPLASGDELIVQVAREAVKTKDAVLTCNLTLTGKYCVLTVNKPHINFSSKIHDEAWKREIRKLLRAEMEPEFGLIVRTNAYDASSERILEELRQLKQRYHSILENGRFRTCYSLLTETAPSYISRLRDTYSSAMDEIVTDQPDVYQAVGEYLNREQPEDAAKLRFYQDPLVSLVKLYSVEKAIDDALQKRVWLKSGGYLVIEQTEAMTVIDVNTGKYSGKKNVDDTLFKINMEAAEETARQLRLRNLSGIIIVDFIDMEQGERQAELMEFLTAQCERDPIRTTVVDMTRLNLVEITRKKVRKPLREQMSTAG